MIERRAAVDEALVPPETELRITTAESTPECARLYCSGEIDASTAKLLANAIESTRPAYRRVEVDMAEVTFLDSSGINTLVRHRSDAYELVLVEVPRDIRRLFEITGLAPFFLR